MKIKANAKMEFSHMGAERRQTESASCGMTLYPLTLVMMERPDKLTEEMIGKMFTHQLGKPFTAEQIHKYGIDPNTYYEAYFSGEVRYKSITIVKVWYNLVT